MNKKILLVVFSIFNSFTFCQDSIILDANGKLSYTEIA